MTSPTCRCSRPERGASSSTTRSTCSRRLSSARRLTSRPGAAWGLTATLVREDGREGDVFALIGPKRYDVPWRDLEQRAWIATAVCMEVRVPMSEERRMEYALAERRAQFRIAAENPEKIDARPVDPRPHVRRAACSSSASTSPSSSSSRGSCRRRS